MTRNTEDFRSRQIDSILFKTEACYPGQEFDPVSIAVWHEALAEYETSDIAEAFSKHIKGSIYLPKICEILALLKENKEPKISIDARSQREWRTVITAIAENGRARPPIFSDPITAYLVRTQFRWSFLCDMKQENENWEEKRWCEAYKLASEAHPNLKQIEAPHNVQELARSITHSVGGPASLHEVPLEKIKKFREKLRGRVQDQDDREARIAMLKKQAEKIKNEKDEDNAI